MNEYEFNGQGNGNGGTIGNQILNFAFLLSEAENNIDVRFKNLLPDQIAKIKSCVRKIPALLKTYSGLTAGIEAWKGVL